MMRRPPSEQRLRSFWWEYVEPFWPHPYRDWRNRLIADATGHTLDFIAMCEKAAARRRSAR